MTNPDGFLPSSAWRVLALGAHPTTDPQGPGGQGDAEPLGQRRSGIPWVGKCAARGWRWAGDCHPLFGQSWLAESPGPLCCALSSAWHGQAGSALYKPPPPPTLSDPTQVVGLILHPAAPALAITTRSPPDPGTPRTTVTGAEAKGTRCAPAGLSALFFWRQLRAEQPQPYCLGFCDQT